MQRIQNQQWQEIIIELMQLNCLIAHWLDNADAVGSKTSFWSCCLFCALYAHCQCLSLSNTRCWIREKPLHWFRDGWLASPIAAVNGQSLARPRWGWNKARGKCIAHQPVMWLIWRSRVERGINLHPRADCLQAQTRQDAVSWDKWREWSISCKRSRRRSALNRY